MYYINLSSIYKQKYLISFININGINLQVSQILSVNLKTKANQLSNYSQYKTALQILFPCLYPAVREDLRYLFPILFPDQYLRFEILLKYILVNMCASHIR